MTKDEFLKKYHNYVADEEQAKAEAAKVNELGVENDEVVAVCFGMHLRWGLVLKSVFDELIILGLL